MPGHIEVIDMESNCIDSVKTKRFGKMFADRGFKFPAREAVANVTTRKAYDNGYLLIDANNDLYHLKMQVDRPSMSRIDRQADITPRHVFVLENGDRAHYGIITTEEGRTFAIARDDNYSLIELDSIKFDPEKQRMSILKGLFVWTVKVSDDEKIVCTALNNDDCSYITSYTYVYPANKLDEITSWIFPFSIHFTTSTDMFVYPRLSHYSWHTIFINTILCLLLFILIKKRNQKCLLPKILVTLCFGIFAFIPLVLIKR